MEYNSYEFIKFIYIGKSYLRSFIFPLLNGNNFFLTLTDLGNSFLKKSSKVKRYIYIFHSITSTHMCYKEDAFDNYDIIMCVGQHQIDEITKAEKIRNLPTKTKLKYTHQKIQDIQNLNISQNTSKNVIIASSWGPGSIIESCDTEFFENILSTKFKFYLQLHPMTKENKEVKPDLKYLKNKYDNFDFSYDHKSIHEISKYYTMISEWSGAITEFALGFLRPVIFLNTAKKIRNHNYEILGLTPLEISIREKLGIVVENNSNINFDNIFNKIIEFNNDNYFVENIKKTRNKTLFSYRETTDIFKYL